MRKSKKILSLAVAVMLCLLACLLPTGASAAEYTPLSGVYEGYYYASQGQTGLTLTILSEERGIFEFYNMPGHTNAKDGSYYVDITYDNGQVYLTGSEWIDHPSGWAFVDFRGTAEDGMYTGTVNNDSSWPFELLQENAAQEELRENLFTHHRYELVDEPLTWREAKAACEAKGGYLACITSQEENDYICQYVKKGTSTYYWLGGTDEAREGVWTWVNGEPWEYNNWASSQPDNGYTGGEDYLGISRGYNSWASAWEWNDFTNTGSSANLGGYICEWDEYSEGSQWATPELEEAVANNLIPNSLIGADMTQPITRGEFAAVAVQLYEQLTGGRAVIASNAHFTDIANDVNRNAILKAYNINAALGVSDTAFAPGDLLTREQMATMLCRVFKRTQWPEWTVAQDDEAKYALDISGTPLFSDDAAISDFARQSVYFMVKSGILSGVGDNKFAPKNTTTQEEALRYANATREQAVVVALRMLKTYDFPS